MGKPQTVSDGAMELGNPALTGVPFNDAYRYMDWLLTVPLLLIEILLVMKLDAHTYSEKAKTLGVGSALMIVSGYYGELVITGDLTPRWMCWFISMMFFLYIVYELLVGLSEATNSEADPVIKGKIQTAQVMTVISWCTYPVVYLFPMLGINAAHAVMGIQIGYCVSDIISKWSWSGHLPDHIREVHEGDVHVRGKQQRSFRNSHHFRETLRLSPKCGVDMTFRQLTSCCNEGGCF